MTYYLYRHIRLDTNVPFYIGIGRYINKQYRTCNSQYRRAFSKRNRNQYWQNIINVTDFRTEIILESNNLEYIKSKEIEFIDLYGRSNLNKGTLCNLTNGGDGGAGYICSFATKQKMKVNSAFKNKTGHQHHLSQAVFCYRITGEFVGEYGSHRELERCLNIDRGNINQCLNRHVQQCYGYVFFKEYQGTCIDEISIKNKKIRKIKCLNDNLEIIQVYNSVTLAAKTVGTQTTNISKACKNEKSKIKGFYWRYCEEDNS